MTTKYDELARLAQKLTAESCAPERFIAQQEFNAKVLDPATILSMHSDLVEDAKTFEAIKHSITQARIYGNDWRRELVLIEGLVNAALARVKGETT